MTLSAAVSNLATKAGSISGIKSAPNYVPESANVFPFVAVYPGTGNLELQSAGWGKFFHTISVDFHVARTILPKAIADAIGFVEAFSKLVIDDPTLGGSVSEVTAIAYTFARMSFGEIDTIGYHLNVTTKILQTT